MLMLMLQYTSISYCYSHSPLSYHILVFLPCHFSSMEQMLILMLAEYLSSLNYADSEVRMDTAENKRKPT